MGVGTLGAAQNALKGAPDFLPTKKFVMFNRITS